MIVLDGNSAVGCGPAWNRLPLNKYISLYDWMNRCYNERGSRTNYVRSSIPHCIWSTYCLPHYHSFKTVNSLEQNCKGIQVQLDN